MFGLPFAATAGLLGMIAGCAWTGLEWAPKGPYLVYHRELPGAERVIQAARAAGKDRECPADFQAAERLKDGAYEIYWAGRMTEAIARANEAASQAGALCPRAPEAPRAAAPPAPAVTLTASPPVIRAGECSVLTWSSTSATEAAIEPGIGAVEPSGSRQVCPASRTSYRIIAAGPGGTVGGSTAVDVTAAPPPSAPEVSLSADPRTIRAGQCSTLTWSSTNAAGAVLEPGLFSVSPSGSRQVCPRAPTTYRITVTGPGGAQTATTAVAVTAAPRGRRPTASPAPMERLVLRINFDFNEATIRAADIAELQKAVEFLTRYPASKISIEGHTDRSGNAAYNQALSARRAAAVKDYLLQHGVPDGGRISTVGHGASKPVARNATREGRIQNRRVEILVLPD
jgi:outer membrane protein OmpA-like peptidoglycan-associated protein